MKRCKIYQTQRYKNVVKVVRVVRFSKSLGWIRLSGCQTLTTKEKNSGYGGFSKWLEKNPTTAMVSGLSSQYYHSNPKKIIRKEILWI